MDTLIKFKSNIPLQTIVFVETMLHKRGIFYSIYECNSNSNEFNPQFTDLKFKGEYDFIKIKK